MKQHILIIGAGFGGVWSALSAVRLLDKHDRNDVRISLLAPKRSCVSARGSTSPMYIPCWPRLMRCSTLWA